MFPVKDASNNKTKYAGRSIAVVLDNRDPLQQGRIRVTHPILGDTVWVAYLKTPGLFDVPPIGTVVYVECDAGFGTHPIAWGNIPKDEDIPSEFQRSIPTNRGLHSPNGQLIELDDGEATLSNDPVDTNYTTKNKGIRITSSDSNKIHIIEDSDNNNTMILIQDNGGNFIKLDYGNNKNLTINAADKLTVTVTGDANITANNINATANVKAVIDAPTIDLGAAAVDSVLKGTTFTSLFDSHFHLSNGPVPGTPTSPPTIPLPPTVLSTKVKVE